MKVSARETEALTARCDAAGTGTLNSAHPSGTAHLLTRLSGQLRKREGKLNGVVNFLWVKAGMRARDECVMVYCRELTGKTGGANKLVGRMSTINPPRVGVWVK